MCQTQKQLTPQLLASITMLYLPETTLGRLAVALHWSLLMLLFRFHLWRHPATYLTQLSLISIIYQAWR